MKVILCIIYISFLSACIHIPDAARQQHETGELHLLIHAGVPFGSEELSNINITGTGPSQTMFTRQIRQVGKPVVLNDLPAGVWRVTVEGVNSSSVPTAFSSRSVTVTAGKTTERTVFLMPEVSQGTLEVAVSLPDSVYPPGRVRASLQQLPYGEEIPLENAGGTCLKADALSGYYLLSAVLHRAGGEIIWEGITSVRITGGETQEIALAFSETLFGTFSFQHHTHLPVSVRISGIVPDLKTDEPMILEAHCFPEAPASGLRYKFIWKTSDGMYLMSSSGKLSYWAGNTPGKRQLTLVVLAVDSSGRVAQAGSTSALFHIRE